MADRLSVYNAVLVILGNRTLASITENRPERLSLDRVWNDTLEYLLDGALWKFALRTEELQVSDTATSQFGYQFVCELPDDYVRIYRICDNERFRPTLIDFSIEGDFIFTDCAPLYLMYVSDADDCGSDPGKWSPAFVKAFTDELALRAAPGMTSAGAPKIAELEKKAKRSFYIAKSRDSVNQPEAFLPAGRLVRARSGWQRINNMRRTPYQ